MRAAHGMRRPTVALGLALGLSLSSLALPADRSPFPGVPVAQAATSADSARKASAPRPHRALENWSRSKSWGFDRIASRDWNVRDRTYNSNEHSYLLARNTTTRNGKLRIQGKRESYGGRSYTSGYIDTNEKFSLPNYFRVEIRAKVPMEQGMWAAPVWFRPADYSGGEIDLIETYGRERHRPLIHHTIHTDYGSSHQKDARPVEYARIGDPTGTKWHRYVIRKTPGKIVMSVDGRRTAVFRSGSPDWFNRFYEAGKRWNMRVNLQIGGSWGGLPDSSTDWSRDKTTMKVDYIHTWTRK